jgi:pyruvate dehydrogenase E2 component (dihydrolipoamide acetyltransferase)
VGKGDVIFDVETDKATLEVESPAAGFVKHILAEVGATLAVNAAVMVLGEKDEDVPRDFIDSLGAGAAPAAAGPQPAQEQPPPAAAAAAKPPTAGAIASPRAKKLAADLAVDISAVTGTGPGGRITEDDVRAAAAPAGAGARPGAAIPLSRMQKITGEKMLRSKREIPCFYLNVRADVTDLVELRNKLNENAGVRLSYNDFIVKAVAAALEKFPTMTGQLEGDSIRLAGEINVGLAMAVGDDLVAPILKQVGKKTIAEIAADRQALAERARARKLGTGDIEGGCITVSNLGGLGIDAFTPIVVPGQCSILGVGRIIDTCVPDGEGGAFTVRKLMNLTLSVDHRITNGAYAAQFLDRVRQLLEDVKEVVK